MMTNEQIRNEIEIISQMEAKIKELKKVVEASKNTLKAELDERKEDMVDIGTHHIFYEPVAKKVVDTKRLKADGLYDEYSKDSISTMFRITVCIND